MSAKRAADNTNGPHWFKSSHSGSDGGDCVEVATEMNTVYVRDSKTADGGPVLRVGRAEWTAFAAYTTG